MSEQTNTDSLEKQIEWRISEFDRYYQTVLLTLGLKDFLDQHAKNCRFISAEPRFFVENTKREVKPDIVLQYLPKHGVLCEVKTSLPLSEGYLLKELKQVEKYSQNVLGWDSNDGKIDNHDILLFCPMIDFDRVIMKFQDWVKKGKLVLTKEICICEWGMMLYPKWGKEIILIRKRFGKTGCNELNNFLQQNIKLDIRKLHVKYEKCKFTRKDPPIEYLMAQLWQDVFPAISRKAKHFETSVKEVLEKAYEYYIPWSNLQGEFSQIRERWIKNAMDSFCEIGLAVCSSTDSEIYKISLGTKTKDVNKYIIEKLCRVALAKKTKGIIIEEEKVGIEQKSLDSFI